MIAKLSVIALCSVALLGSGTAHAQQPPASAFGTCLADSTSGKERKDLAKWIFAGMGAHPDIASLSRIGPDDRRALDQQMAALFSRLITQDCVTHARSASQGGQAQEAFRIAFEVLGRVAMMELMASPLVNQAMSSFTQHLDQQKINAALMPK